MNQEDRIEKLKALFDEYHFSTFADIKEVDMFLTDLYLRCNSEQFITLFNKIHELKENGEL